MRTSLWIRINSLQVVVPLRGWGVLAGHTHHDAFQLLVDAGTSERRARLCAVTRLSHKFVVPGEDGVRLRNRRNLLQGLPAKLFPNLD